MIDLRSDTFSLPSEPLRNFLTHAEVGDDYYGEDRSVNRLEDYCIELFGKEAALFTTTGMLANNLAIAAQVPRGNEIITEYNYHINLYESAQYASLCQIVTNARETGDGVLRVEDVERAIRSKPRDPLYAQVRLVSIENTISSRGGKVFPFSELQRLRSFTQQQGVRLHMDGVRIFNAHVKTGIALASYAREVDTLSIAFSKGLGAPFGAVLLGPGDVIQQARRLRVWYGSGFHKVGFQAAAALFALTQQMDQITEDHRLAKLLADQLFLRARIFIDPEEVETNIVHLDLADSGIEACHFEQKCRERGLLVMIFPPNIIRMVVCRNVNEQDILEASNVLAAVSRELFAETKGLAVAHRTQKW
jgi:threonine aldolase